MNDNLKALDDLISDAMAEEKSLAVRADELALQSKQFADYLAEKKHSDEKLAVLWDMVRDYMEENGYTEYDNEYINIKLVPLGKYKADNIDDVPDDVCKIVKQIDNKKVKAYIELNGQLPQGVKSLGNRLVKKVKND